MSIALILGLLASLFVLFRSERSTARAGLAYNLNAMPAGVVDWIQEAEAAAQKTDIDPALILAIIWQESAGRPDARGLSGEIGLMQLKEAAATDAQIYLGSPSGLDWRANPADNILIGAAYLANQRKITGNTEDAIRAYNQGVTGMKRNPEAAQNYLNGVIAKWQAIR